MKEEDLSKHLDNILIEGLIKEAEQDNADLEAAMRGISDDAFDEIVMEPELAESEYSSCADTAYSRFAPANYCSCPKEDNRSSAAASMVSGFHDDDMEEISVVTKRTSRFKMLRPWIASIVSAAAVIAIVLIPSISYMNGKLCDSAVYMSEVYITASKGGLDLSSASNAQIEEALPSLEERYQNASDEGVFTEDFPEAAWDLAVAYLRLHKKGDAVKVLRILESRTKGTPMGTHCGTLLKQLD